MKNIICKIIGHSFLYNFPVMPSKCICKRCSLKMKINFATLEFDIVDKFDKKLGDDKELINRWFNFKTK